ncbi:pilus assembly protein [Achromobacter pestifer]|uniref:Putative fimbrial-like protein YfcQ n=1 Tax=Achromobacter pestifer TaxID=1353889 RepID=A0A6S6YTI5_9BURK|nr:pilus assembly protein [Achromobacter pestifer]CAB3639963.1 putative fimbrial-like protein YfcQ [Achromobacter pestifer]
MNMINPLRRIGRIALLIVLGNFSQPIGAAENMRFTGMLQAPACVVTDQGGRINVTFNTNISIEKIDGEQYRQPISYDIECPNEPPWRIKLTLVATETSFDPAAVQTSIPDLGIRILLNNKPFILNETQRLQMNDRTQRPQLEAVPVRKSGARLPQAEFEAWALLVAELY